MTLHKRLRALEIDASPFANKVPRTSAPVHWVRPELVAQVQFTEWTNGGSMRHPTFLGLREDKKPTECVREAPLHVETNDANEKRTTTKKSKKRKTISRDD